jgi:hypothetical protein
MMPKKLKQEPRADELEKPYEARPLADDAKKRVVAQCAQKRGRAPGFLMSEERRGKIKNSSILNALIEYFQGKREMSGTQVRVGLRLLKTVLPDLRPVTPEFSIRRSLEAIIRLRQGPLEVKQKHAGEASEIQAGISSG